jgi:FlaA1/EpsC-like NDP-sugar epimerase
VPSRLDHLDWLTFLARPRLPSPDLSVLDALYTQSFLITGAGGSTGSALAQRLTAVSPSCLVLLDSSESRLFKLQQEWADRSAPASIKPILGSVADRLLLDEVFTVYAPRIVFHAAAFHHVPLMEQQPLAAVYNNVFGTLRLVRAAGAANARVVLVSADKAVEPASVMGATKRLAEQIVLAAGGTVLRLGNVLGTRDGVTELFARQLAAGRPLTVTDPAARRHFLTIDEAVNMLLIAAVEPGAPLLLAPEVSAPHYIADLAQFMAQALAPERPIEIDFTALRPGDKEVERLWSSKEFVRPAASHGLLRIESPVPSEAELDGPLANLASAVEARDLHAALALLCELVPEYTPGQVVLAHAGLRIPS